MYMESPLKYTHSGAATAFNMTNRGSESSITSPVVTNAEPGEQAVLLSPEKEHKGSGSVVGTYLNILKNIVGTGMLAIPYCMSLAGWGTALGLMGGIMVAAALNLVLIMRSCDFVRESGGNPSSYLALAEAAWGPKIGKYVEIIVACYTSCTLIAYGVLFPQFLGDQPYAPGWVTSRVAVLIYAAVIIFPLCIMDTIEKLRVTSLLGNAVILYTVCLVFQNYIVNGDVFSGGISPANTGLGVLQALPTLLFAYNFHYNMPVYYKELKDRSIKKMLSIIAAVYVTVSVLYLVIGFAGYFTYGEKVKSNIVMNLKSGVSAGVCKVLLGIMILFTYPIIHFAARGAIGRVTVCKTGSLSFRHRCIIASGIIMVTLGLSFAVPNIGVALAFNGAIFGVTQQYFIPTLAFYKLSEGRVPMWQRRAALVQCALGVAVCVLGVIGTISNLVDGNSR